MRLGASIRQRAPSVAPHSKGLEDVAASVVSLRKALGGIFDSAGVRGSTLGLASESATHAVSSHALGLDLSASHTTLSSSEKFLASGTFSDPHPEFAGASTSQPTLGGAYAGPDDVLTFEVKKGSKKPGDDFEIEVFDGRGKKVDRLHFKFKKGEPVEPTQTLENGLTLAFSPGTLVKGDSFELAVYADGAADPSRSFDSRGRPLFEGHRVVKPGSFEVNGAKIDVKGSDSIFSVVDRISQSAAGVSASFDAASGKILLEHDQAGAHAIHVGNDTSGFLAAVELADAEPVLGKESDLTTPLAELVRFKGVQPGTFVVGEQTIRVDPMRDTLDDVLRRVSAVPGIDAAYDAKSDTVAIAADAPGAAFALGQDTSGLLAALRLDEGTFGSEVTLERRRARGQLQVTRHQVFRDSLREFGKSLESLFDGGYSASARSTIEGTLRALQAAVAGALEDSGRDGSGEELETGLGLEFSFAEGAQRGLRVDSRRLQRALENGGEELGRLLFGRGDAPNDEGLAARLDAALELAGDALANRLGAGRDVGWLLDLRG
jgi:hypothetical protein